MHHGLIAESEMQTKQLGAVHILRQPKSGVPGPPLHSGPGCGHINLVKVDEKCGEMRIKLSDHCYP